MNKDIKILVAHHKEYFTFSNQYFLPIHAGKEISKINIDMQGDNTGDNISAKNLNLNELTVLYWAWKNLDADYIGLCHYRRYFSSSYKFSLTHKIIKHSINSFLNKVKIKSHLSNLEYTVKINNVPALIKSLNKFSKLLPSYCSPNIFYIAKPWIYPNESIMEHYGKLHNKKNIDILHTIISKFSPEYEVDFNIFFNGNKFSPCLMFLCSKKWFNDYMEWLFKIIPEMEKNISTKEDPRAIAFLVERLFNVYVTHKARINALSIKYFPITLCSL